MLRQGDWVRVLRNRSGLYSPTEGKRLEPYEAIKVEGCFKGETKQGIVIYHTAVYGEQKIPLSDVEPIVGCICATPVRSVLGCRCGHATVVAWEADQQRNQIAQLQTIMAYQ